MLESGKAQIPLYVDFPVTSATKFGLKGTLWVCRGLTEKSA